MTPHDYDFLRALLKARSGLSLSDEKQYLVESRLGPLARKSGIATVDALIHKLRAPGAESLTIEVVEAMTTNESFFFRDKTPFENFRQVMMPALMAARASQKRIRIWCAAASAGQEPYSLAMTIKDMERELGGMRFEILATDLSTEILAKAKSGIYSQFEVQRGLPIQQLVKHFTKIGEMWQISQDIRAMVQFRPLNLLRDFSSLGTFDIVFCRNVLIYFDQQTKMDVLSRLARVTAPDGYLLMGAAETVIGLTTQFKAVPDRRGLYAPDKAPANVVAFPARSVA